MCKALNAPFHGDVAQRQNGRFDRVDRNSVFGGQGDCVIPVGVAVLDMLRTNFEQHDAPA